MENKINSGNYMVVESVVNYIEHTTGKKSNIKLPTHKDENLNFYDTNDLKSIMPKDMFREMECVVTTYVIG